MKVLTFDIEDWFHILDNDKTADPSSWKLFPSRLATGVDRILKLLSDNDQTATFFCLGWVAENHPMVVKRILEGGHHIATHSHTHQLAYVQTKREYREDLWRSIDTLQQLCGRRIDTYRAPGFSITSKNLWAFEVMQDLGIRVDCSIFPARRAHGGIVQYASARPSIVEYGDSLLKSFPINTTKIFGRDIVYSGGGYFRILPLNYLKRRFTQDEYVMTYFHPRDFDPDQPMVPGLDLTRRFKSYVGLGGTHRKLEFLLRKHQFISVETAVDIVDWEAVDTVCLA